MYNFYLAMQDTDIQCHESASIAHGSNQPIPIGKNVPGPPGFSNTSRNGKQRPPRPGTASGRLAPSSPPSGGLVRVARWGDLGGPSCHLVPTKLKDNSEAS